MQYFETLAFVDIIRLEFALGELECLKFNIYMSSYQRLERTHRLETFTVLYKKLEMIYMR